MKAIARSMAIGRTEAVFTAYSVLFMACFGTGLWLGFTYSSPYAFLAVALVPPALLLWYLVAGRPFSILPEVLEEFDPHIFKLISMQSERNNMGRREFLELAKMRIRDTQRSDLSPMMHRFLERRKMAVWAVVVPVVISLGMFAVMLVVHINSL